MLNLNIAICDDDPLYRRNLLYCLDSYLLSTDTDIRCTEFSSPQELLHSYQNEGDFHILFLDVEMPGLNGLELAKRIKSTIDRHVFIVFISNYPDYMQDSFRVHPYYYLIKPVSAEKVHQIMDEIIHEITEEQILYTLIQTDETEKTVNIKDIFYIDVSNGKKGILCFHFYDTVIQTRGKLTDWTDKLQEYYFIPCYRGILLNLLHVHYFQQHSAILENGECIPLSRSYEKKIRDTYLNNIVTLKKL